MFDIPGAIKSVTNFAGKFFTDKTKKMELSAAHAQLLIETNVQMAKLAVEKAAEGDMRVYNDLVSSRNLYAKEMERAPVVIRLLNGLVRPLGGLGALATLFWVAWAPYFGYAPFSIPEFKWENPFWMLVESIIAFFFVLRHRAQVAGVKDR